MIVNLNNQPHEVEEGTTLAAFVESLGMKPAGIAVAIDFAVVPKDKWAETLLADRMELMLIHAVSGG